jgi:hypothetical protein
MARKLLTVMILATFALAGAAVADNEDDIIDPIMNSLGSIQAEAVPVGLAKADVDTLYLMGGTERQDGKFENIYGNPEWQGWESEDFTFNGVEAWNVSSERVLDGAYSMVCGVDVEVPGGYNFGYGNLWRNPLVFKYEVDDPGESSTVRITARMRVDTEPEYDYVYLQVYRTEGWTNIAEEAVWDGTRTYNIDFTATIDPNDYTGPSYDELWVRWYFESDGGWSDEDGDFESDGPCWLDNLAVIVDGTEVDYEDFEDGVSDHWVEEVVGGVGDFAQLYSGLQDLDPCRSNTSVQVAFVDDGLVVPGTGGTQCTTWCYGPGGYIVNNTGGMLGPDYYIENGILSPPIAWPENADAAELIFGVYMHEPMTPSSGGTMYVWWVRSTTSEDPYDLKFEDWQWDNTVWFGPPVYQNHPIDLNTYLTPGRRWFQIRLEVWEAGRFFDVFGFDGTPHPYFDNIRVLAYPYGGPALNYDPLFNAQDNFPEIGDLDFGNLAMNHIRFDMARNISPTADNRNDPGDSLFVDVVPVRAGSTLDEMPRMVVRMKANDLFRPYRSLPAGFTSTEGFFEDGADLIEGAVYGDSTYNNLGTLVEDRYHFDLPDTGFFYPGDVIHYYYEAYDNLAGDIGHTMLPGDTTGFASFQHDLNYHSDFICRGLPTLFTNVAGEQPKILLWNDFGSRGGENEWYFALKGCGMYEGVDYDIYHTNAPDASEGNGLGGRATSAVLDGYDILLYTAGNLLNNLLSSGVYASDPSQDIQVVDAWFLRGNKKAFMTGDNLFFDLQNQGALGQAFTNNYLGAQFISNEVRNYIAGQTAPIVRAASDNGIFETADYWLAYGGCLGINAFDAIEPIANGIRLAEFTDENGNTGVYSYAAALYHYNTTTDTEVITMPYDFMFAQNAPGYEPPSGLIGLSARTLMLRDILNHFGMQLEAPIGVGDTPVAQHLDMRAYPNPFNPKTTLELSLPRAGQVSVKIFNVRGELIKTLVDGNLQAGMHQLTWDGTDRNGARSASGVYFAETRAVGQTKVTRMALIK